LLAPPTPLLTDPLQDMIPMHTKVPEEDTAISNPTRSHVSPAMYGTTSIEQKVADGARGGQQDQTQRRGQRTN
jgi:hypothetical protein